MPIFEKFNFCSTYFQHPPIKGYLIWLLFIYLYRYLSYHPIGHIYFTLTCLFQLGADDIIVLSGWLSLVKIPWEEFSFLYGHWTLNIMMSCFFLGELLMYFRIVTCSIQCLISSWLGLTFHRFVFI